MWEVDPSVFRDLISLLLGGPANNVFSFLMFLSYHHKESNSNSFMTMFSVNRLRFNSLPCGYQRIFISRGTRLEVNRL